MRAVLKLTTKTGVRALERQTLHELADAQVVQRHLASDPQAFGALVDRPEHHRVVFVLRELEGKSYEEIAEITGCNLGTVKSRLNRARNSFAQLIGPMVE